MRLPDPPIVNRLRTALLEFDRDHRATFPWRTTSNHWHALAAEVMLQRTRAEQVVPVYETFTARYSDPTAFVADPEGNRLFESLGLHWRTASLRKLAVVLVTEKSIPTDRDSLLALPGIGAYIAAAYRSLHAEVGDTIVDSNVVRFYGRYFSFATDGETRRKKWFIALAEHLTPPDQFKAYNYGLIDFTRTLCRPKPRCKDCPLRIDCPAARL